MRINSHELPTRSHSNELESRLTTVEVVQSERLESNTARWSAMDGRVTYLERAVQGLIYAVAALATSKSGDVMDVLLSIAKAKI